MSKICHSDKETTLHPTMEELDEHRKKIGNILFNAANNSNPDFDRKLQAIKRRQDFNDEFLIEDRSNSLILLEKLFTSDLTADEIIHSSSHIYNYLNCTSDEYIIKETMALLEKIPSLKDIIYTVYQKEIINDQTLYGFSDVFYKQNQRNYTG